MESPTQTSDLSFWEKVAVSRWGAYTTDVEKQVILKARSLAHSPTRAVEVGCEGGRWSKMLSEMDCKMTCIDVNPQALSMCERRIPAAECLLADPSATSLPCKSDSFDLLLCIEVAPVIQSAWILPEVSRVLTHNGVFVGVFWNRTSLRGSLARLKNLAQRRAVFDFYKLPYAPWRAKLIEAGFQLVHEEGFCWGPFGRASDSFLVPFFVNMERALQLNRAVGLSPWIAFIAKRVSRT
jgi:ubiquinone/menaquinone biosynthesis C-methylase UbiE